MRTQQELEQLIRENFYKEVQYLHNGGRYHESFTISLAHNGIAPYGAIVRIPEQWQTSTPLAFHYGDTLEDVIAQAEKDYPEIRQWYGRFRPV